MKFAKTVLVVLLMAASHYCFSIIDLTKVNFNYKYDPDSEIQYHYKVAIVEDVATIFLRLDFNPEKITNPENFSISYEIRKNYTNPEILQEDTLSLQNLILSENNNRYYRFNVPVLKNESLILLKVVNQTNNTEYLFDIPVDLPLQFPNSSLILMEKDRDIPVFSDYIHQNDSVRLVSLKEGVEQVYFFHYSKDFSAAAPPMTTQPTAVDKEMEVDSSAAILINRPFSLQEKGLYLFQTDTTTAQGLSFLVADNYYPQFVKAETLIEPIVFISTSREIRKIRNTEDKKKAMDVYWLELTKSPERSKGIIRDYYRQIELANYLFTSYKAGWKTDKGMILTLFGKPDAVFTDGEVEEWNYERRGSNSRINFTFIKIKNIFTDDHYELVRNAAYDREWFRIVDQWRKGRQEI